VSVLCYSFCKPMTLQTATDGEWEWETKYVDKFCSLPFHRMTPTNEAILQFAVAAQGSLPSPLQVLGSFMLRVATGWGGGWLVTDNDLEMYVRHLSYFVSALADRGVTRAPHSPCLRRHIHTHLPSHIVSPSVGLL